MEFCAELCLFGQVQTPGVFEQRNIQRPLISCSSGRKHCRGSEHLVHTKDTHSEDVGNLYYFRVFSRRGFNDGIRVKPKFIQFVLFWLHSIFFRSVYETGRSTQPQTTGPLRCGPFFMTTSSSPINSPLDGSAVSQSQDAPSDLQEMSAPKTESELGSERPNLAAAYGCSELVQTAYTSAPLPAHLRQDLEVVSVSKHLDSAYIEYWLVVQGKVIRPGK